jgi:Flp pilus assembly protein TadG
MKASRFLRHFGQSATSFWHDTSGVMLPYIAVLLPIIVGVSLLALDGAGRAFSLQTQLQNIADAAALAGAAELNRAPPSGSDPGARQRARNAITNLVTNQLAGMDVTNVTLATPVFYETLPAANQYFSSGTVAADDGHARFVAVTLTHTMNTILPVSFLRSGAANSYTAGAQAVAGSDRMSCSDTPVFICNPFETSSMTYDQATTALQTASTSTLVALQGASNSTYFPGNFGWIAPPVQGTASGSCGSGNAVAQASARKNPPVCFRTSTINTHPGNITAATEGFNTRFDLYGGSFGSCQNNPNYPPAPNVRKGYLPGTCNPSPVGFNNSPKQYDPNLYPAGHIQAMGFPLDSNMLNPDGTPNLTNTLPALGNGNWSCGDTNLATSAANNSTGGTCSGRGNSFTPAPGCWLNFTSTAGIYAGMGVKNATHPSSISPTTYVLLKETNRVLLSEAILANVSSGDAITFAGYWNTAHPAGQSPPNPGAGHPPMTGLTTGCTAPATISRESVYRYENDPLNWTPSNPSMNVINVNSSNNYVNDRSAGNEVGAPRCSTSITPDSNRRYLNVAVLNCLNLESEGYSLSGSASNLPVAAIARFFLTLPVISSSGPMFAEFVGIVPPVGGPGNPQNKDRLQVQLYR